MDTFDFTLVLDREPSGEELDALFEVGCDDATPETGAGTALLHVDREAATLPEAIVSALRQVESAGFRVLALRSDDLVTLKEIATRTARTYESIRLLAAGKRGPGHFPPALSTEGWSLYSWAQVNEWFAREYETGVPAVSEYDRIIAAADLIVRARALLPETGLGELARLAS